MALIRCNTSGGGASVVPVTLIYSEYSSGNISKTVPIEDGKRYIIISAYLRSDSSTDYNTYWIYENGTLTQYGTSSATTSGACAVSGNNIVYTHSSASYKVKVYIFEC